MPAVSAMQTEQSAAERYEALLRISNLIRARRESEGLFEILAHELGQVIPFDAIAQFDESANKVNWYLGPACSDRDPGPCEADGESLPAWVYRNQETVVLNTVDYDPRFPETSEILRAKGLKSVCAIPLTTAHRRLGSLILGRADINSFTRDEVRFCSLVVDQIALATDDAINFRASQNARERLQLLLDLTNRVVSNLNLGDVLREISAQIRRVMECDGVGIALACPGDGKLRLCALDFPDAPMAIEEGAEIEHEEKESAARVFRSGEAHILDEDEIQSEQIAVTHGIESLAHVPVIGSHGILGVLTLGTFRPEAFEEQDLPFLNQVARQVAIAIENARTFGEVSEQRERLTLEKLYLEDEIRSELKFEEIVGRSAALRRVLDEIQTVAPTDSTVLIYGETGSGKELIARALHNLSSRQSGAFVKLNCAAIPTGLLESELFGHEKGAFTGAIAQRVGRFELAHRGTIFLDEIGEIPLELQPKLLRVLQEREFERLGSTRTVRTDARLIAATNRDLQQLVSEQKFRSDLFYRLNVFPVRVPSLRERPEDIPLLVRHFVQQFSRPFGKTIDSIDSETMTALTRYPWPGNIRELQNIIERAVILTSGPVLRVNTDELNAPNAATPIVRNGDAPASAQAVTDLRSALEQTEREQILAALEKSNWVVAGEGGAATLLGLKRSTLQARMQKLGIRISRVAG